MSLLLTIHSIIRWLILLAALAVVIRFAIGWWKKQPFDGVARGLSSAFSGLMDTQWLIGLLFFIWNGLAIENGFAIRQRWEHLVIMTIAVVVAHLPAMWKKKEGDLRYRNGLFAVLAALVLVVVGISLLPGNRWLTISGLF